MIKIRNMVEGDIASAVRLTNTMEWDFEDKDFKFMMELEPKGCFVALDDNRFIGLTTTISFDNLGWIGNVIIEMDYRDKGIGSTLVQHSISYLKSRGVTTIGLYSYEETVPFYEKLGFKRDKAFIYLVGSGVEYCETKTVKSMGDEDFKKAVELDQYCRGVSREKLLRNIFSKYRNLCYTTFYGDDLVGFVMARKSAKTVEAGPLICKVGSEDRSLDLLNVLLRSFIGFEVYLGIPENKFKMITKLREWKYREKFKVILMYLGNALQDRGCVFAMESLERG